METSMKRRPPSTPPLWWDAVGAAILILTSLALILTWLGLVP